MSPANGDLFPLTCRGLCYHAGGKRLIGPLDLEIAAAGITMIIGYNGAGKSLLLRLLHGLISPGSGSIQWGSQPMCDAVRKRQAMVFQKPVLLRRSVRQNMDFVLAARKRRDADFRDRILEELGLLGMAHQPARSLSGGEQQRLALARALACSPDILFLDEPTASLDPASIGMIEEMIVRVAAGGAKIVMVSHDIAQARRIADDIVFLHRGTCCEHTPASRFFQGAASPQGRAYVEARTHV